MLGLAQLFTSGLFAWNLDANLRRRRRLWLRFDESDSFIIPQWTMAIPVRNEEKNIARLEEELSEQRYLPEKIIFLNDQSQDKTSDAIASLKAKLAKVDVREISGEALPSSWRGKIWALQQLLNSVESPYVLFMDADVSLLHPNALKSLYVDAMPFLEKRKCNFVSVFPKPDVKGSTALVVDQIYMHLFFFLPFFWEKMKSASAVAGCGQVMLINVEELKRRGFLSLISGSTHDGLQLARCFKGLDGSAPFFDGSAAFSCAYYPNLSAAFKGLSRNSWEADGNIGVSLVVSSLLFWNFVLPYVLLPFLLWNPAFLAAFLAMLWAQLRLAEELGLNRSHVFLAPVKAMAAIGVHLWSPLRLKLGLDQQWKGRAV
ncbi:glycosyltransferase [bacterium]|nr:glycosyltransferase [bacterium]